MGDGGSRGYCSGGSTVASAYVFCLLVVGLCDRHLCAAVCTTAVAAFCVVASVYSVVGPGVGAARVAGDNSAACSAAGVGLTEGRDGASSAASTDSPLSAAAAKNFIRSTDGCCSRAHQSGFG